MKNIILPLLILIVLVIHTEQRHKSLKEGSIEINPK